MVSQPAVVLPCSGRERRNIPCILRLERGNPGMRRVKGYVFVGMKSWAIGRVRRWRDFFENKLEKVGNTFDIVKVFVEDSCSFSVFTIASAAYFKTFRMLLYKMFPVQHSWFFGGRLVGWFVSKNVKANTTCDIFFSDICRCTRANV